MSILPWYIRIIHLFQGFIYSIQLIHTLLHVLQLMSLSHVFSLKSRLFIFCEYPVFQTYETEIIPFHVKNIIIMLIENFILNCNNKVKDEKEKKKNKKNRGKKETVKSKNLYLAQKRERVFIFNSLTEMRRALIIGNWPEYERNIILVRSSDGISGHSYLQPDTTWCISRHTFLRHFAELFSGIVTSLFLNFFVILYKHAWQADVEFTEAISDYDGNVISNWYCPCFICNKSLYSLFFIKFSLTFAETICLKGTIWLPYFFHIFIVVFAFNFFIIINFSWLIITTKKKKT